MPGDPFLILTSQSAEDEEIVLSEEQREFLFEYYGLDQPIYKQYLNYLGELVQGNMGFSVYYKQPVSQIVLQRLLCLADRHAIQVSPSRYANVQEYRNTWVKKCPPD
jgi:ABC-type dipeptide/oligopeptide/nickel transport system permease component